MTIADADSQLRGLTAAEVAVRVERGQVNHVDDSSSRSLGEIVRANVLTRFNAIVGAEAIVIYELLPVEGNRGFGEVARYGD